jgi:serine/threonine protein kinase/Tfp pilus assembly protein PilF
MGEVYLARDTRLNRRVALKILPTDSPLNEKQIRRFIQEARAASALSHPNIAHIYEMDTIDGTAFIAMEYVEGQSLQSKLYGHFFDAAKIVDIACQIADALDLAHSRGITHRDIKPANIMITPRDQVKVLDFGLAKFSDAATDLPVSIAITQSETEPGAILGTVQYMSPEQALGRDIDPRTDIFSLGVVLYQMATGRLPFSGASTTETIDRISHTQPDAIARFNYSIPGELDRIIRKCLEKEKERRYQSARELLVDLRNLKRDSDSGPVVATKAASLSRRNLRKAIDSLAVLPMANASADPNTEYLSDGITESIINSLSQIPKLRIVPRSTVFRYKGRDMDPQQVGRELGVRAVLSGRVLQLGDNLIISTELADVANESQLWGQQYKRKLADIFVLQEEISKEISEKLRLRLTGEQKKRLTKRFTQDPDAYQAYLKGRYCWNKRTAPALKKGIEYFHQAIEKDPTYALAYTGLADTYALLGIAEYGVLPPRDTMPKAKAAALKALEIDDTLAEAHTSLAHVCAFFDWDWAAAETEFRRAIEINPNYAFAHHWYALYLAAMERPAEAIVEERKALEIDPLSLIISKNVGTILHYARQYDQAIEQYRRTLELDPDFVRTHLFLGWAYEQDARFEEAVSEFEKALALSPGNTIMQAALGHAYAVGGKMDQTMKILEELKQRSTSEYVPAFTLAMVYAGLGKGEEVFKYLEKAFEERSSWMVSLKVEPMFDSFRSDPRFTDLVRRVGLRP